MEKCFSLSTRATQYGRSDGGLTTFCIQFIHLLPVLQNMIMMIVIADLF